MALIVNPKKVKDKEAPYRKEHIRIMVQIKMKVSPSRKRELRLRKNQRYITQFYRMLIVPVTQITNRDKLAEYIYNHCGIHQDQTTYNLMMWDRWHKTRTYRKDFRCTRVFCQFCPISYKNMTGRHKTCKTWKRHKKGGRCMMNRDRRGAWQIRARITLHRTWDLSGVDSFNYDWDNKADKMHKFSRWFWKN